MARNKHPQVNSLKAPPVTDEGRASYTPDNARARRGAGREDVNSAPRGDDRVYGIESRARWAGGDSESFRLQHAESRRIETGEEEEESDDTDGDGVLSKEELKAALDTAGIDYPARASAAKLASIYKANNLG